MRAARVATGLIIGLVLVSCAAPSRLRTPVAAPKESQVVTSGDTSGLGRLLAQISDSLAQPFDALASSPDLDALLRGLKDTLSTKGLPGADSTTADLKRLLDQLGGRLNTPGNEFPGLGELGALLRSGDDTATLRMLLNQDAGSATLRSLKKCLSDSGTAAHPW